MRPLSRILCLLPLLALPPGGAPLAEASASQFGAISIPAPQKPAAAEQCVEPVEVMRRDHMKFLDHQRDRTVIDGERGSKYSLVGCIDCHNPGDSAEVLRYSDARHFCAECHRYASVEIDCFECHADRGLDADRDDPGSISEVHAPAWRDRGQLSAATLQARSGSGDDN